METLSLRAIFFVFIGGGLGSLLRYFMGWGVARLLGHATAWTTCGVNALGSLLIGYLLGLSAREVGLNEGYRYLLIVGLCGGFTTFSTFSADVLHYLRSGSYLQACCYLLLSVCCALLLVYLGFRWGRS